MEVMSHAIDDHNHHHHHHLDHHHHHNLHKHHHHHHNDHHNHDDHDHHNLHNHHHDHHNSELVMRKPVRRKGKQFTLESYLIYQNTRDLSFFTVTHLNLVLSIHGFRRCKHKNLAEEAVRAIDPTHPARSTLNDSFSPHKPIITYEEAFKDLKALNWQECSISSMRSIKQDTCSTDLVTIPPFTASAKSNFQNAAVKRKAGALMRTSSLPSKVAPLMTATSFPSQISSFMSASSGPSQIGPVMSASSGPIQIAPLMSASSCPSQIEPLTSASSGPSQSYGSSTYSIVPVFPTKFTSKKRSNREVKRPMLSSSTSCTSGPNNSSSSDGCIVALDVM